jgi:hypothetical protein
VLVKEKRVLADGGLAGSRGGRGLNRSTESDGAIRAPDPPLLPGEFPASGREWFVGTIRHQ